MWVDLHKGTSLFCGCWCCGRHRPRAQWPRFDHSEHQTLSFLSVHPPSQTIFHSFISILFYRSQIVLQIYFSLWRSWLGWKCRGVKLGLVDCRTCKKSFWYRFRRWILAWNWSFRLWVVWKLLFGEISGENEGGWHFSMEVLEETDGVVCGGGCENV